MPRPGPRPYECVRRAWHSDRHQPMRGSLIREIFRVVNEIHSSETKKNKEWQEKLPTVVLRAEEIMYSKANSEAEYMDLKTLWERTNDAINTIIRKEESTETGDLLQPCIEAALILGCTARRASRSQRNSNPRCYLSPSTQEPTHVPPRVPDNVTHGGSSRLLPLHSSKATTNPGIISYYPTTMRPTIMDSTQLRLESCSPHTQENNPTMSHDFPSPSKHFSPSASNQLYPMDVHSSANMGRAYPLYYGTHHQTIGPQVLFQPPQGANSNSAVLGMSQVQPVTKLTEKDFLHNLFTYDGAVNTPNRNREADLRSTSGNPPEIECDLSLRLGPFSVPYASAETRHEVEDIGSSSSQEGSKSSDLSPRTRKEFCFFPRDNADDPLESSSSKKGKGPSVDGACSRKQKAPASNLVEGGHLLLRPMFSPDLFLGRMKKPDK